MTMTHTQETWYKLAHGYVSNDMLCLMIWAYYQGHKIKVKPDLSVKPLSIQFFIS
jgi:formate/nitrite transporter FocA (FNT family)